MTTTETTALTAGFHDIDAAVYHGDPCPAPSLSRSIAKTLVDQSPAHAHAAHPRLGGGIPKEPTKEMDRGTLLHKLLLKAGADIQEVDAPDWRTKAAKEAREEIRAAGRIPVLADKYRAMRATAGHIERALAEKDICLSEGDRELTMIWQEERGVWARAMLDHYDGQHTITDLKTCENAHPGALSRKVVDHGLDIQAASYSHGLEVLRPELVGRVKFRFVWVEVGPPYAVSVCELDGEALDHGRGRWNRAVKEWGQCLKRDEWPAYEADLVRLEVPAWAMVEGVER